MKPNTEDATCPKCKTKWFAQKVKVTYCRKPRCKFFTDDWPPRPVPEHLHCTCERCGYEWLMECADAEEDEPDDTGYEIACPSCNAILHLLSEHLEPVYVTFCKAKVIVD